MSGLLFSFSQNLTCTRIPSGSFSVLSKALLRQLDLSLLLVGKDAAKAQQKTHAHKLYAVQPVTAKEPVNSPLTGQMVKLLTFTRWHQVTLCIMLQLHPSISPSAQIPHMAQAIAEQVATWSILAFCISNAGASLLILEVSCTNAILHPQRGCRACYP